MLEENCYSTTLRSLWFWTCSMPMRVFQIHDPLLLFFVGELFVLLGKQSDLALCLCNGGSLYSKGDCCGCEKENYEDYLQFRTLRLLSLFGEMFLWKNLKFYAEMQHTSRNFRQLLNCFENFIVVLRF